MMLQTQTKAAFPLPIVTSFDTLPQELVDLVIDHAHQDASLLATCSLVCKAWHPTARHHLFSKTNLNSNNASSFIQLINSTSSTITPFVRHIDIKDNWECGRWIDKQFIGLRTDLLPSLTSFTLAASFEPVSATTLSTLQTFDRLTDLRLSECEFWDFTQVQLLLCSFPLLQTLYMEADWPEPRVILPTKVSPSPHLRELYLRCEISHILQWFSMQPTTAPISTLTLYGFENAELPVISRYLQALGSALTHLTLVPSGYGCDSLTDHIDLSPNDCLQYLKLIIDCDSGNLLMTSDLLSRLESPTFDEVELSFYSVRQGLNFDRQWAKLDALLSTPRFTSMARVTIAAIFAAAQARHSLPLCEKRGVLCIQHL